MNAAVDKLFEVVLTLCIAGLALCTGLAFLGGTSWVLDLLASFHMHYAVLLAIAAGLAAGTERWRLAGVGWVAFAANLVVIAPLYLPGAPAPQPGADTLHVLSFNVLGGNSRTDDVVEYIARERPDVVIVSELEPHLADELTARLTDYRAAVRPRTDNFGIGVFTLGPEQPAIAVHPGAHALPGTVVGAHIGDLPVTVFGLHPPPPVSPRYAALRDGILHATAAAVRDTPGAVIVCGDLNATHWSYPLRRLRDRAGLIDSARSRGVIPTWPRGLGPLQIPIDHCLHSPDLAVVDRRVGPWLGSDHRPLHVVFTLAR